MNPKGKPSLSELKVGVFVLITCVILGTAVFTIGTQVGLLEDTFYARTYLNNVSGLKPGDIVLLAGVEVGNVTDVQISPADEVPPTQSNQILITRIELWAQQVQELEAEIATSAENLNQARQEYDQRLQEQGEEAGQTRVAQDKVEGLETLVQDQRIELENARTNIERARSNLQNIVVSTEIRSAYRDWIRNDSKISLGSIGLLGDKFIEISLGRSADPPVVIEEITEGLMGPRVYEVVLITGTSQPGFQELITGADDVLANLAVLSNKLTQISEPLAAGQGTVGTFFTDPSFYNNLNRAILSAGETVDQTTLLVREFREGEGTLARLVQDGEVYDMINEATGRLRDILTRVDQSQGTLGKLVNDSSIFDKSEAMVGNIEAITQRIEEGEGTLGRLYSDDQLYEDLSLSLNQIKTFMDDIQQGKGTLGRLANDEQLYQNLNEVSAEVIKLLYDFRQNPKEFLTIKLELF
jgi:phospholipid/cholesterol/gamma-HCH transport system substrate-binding protein